MNDFIYQLTVFDDKHNLLFAEKQLQKYGALENKDYVWKKTSTTEEVALFTQGLKIDKKFWNTSKKI